MAQTYRSHLPYRINLVYRAAGFGASSAFVSSGTAGMRLLCLFTASAAAQAITSAQMSINLAFAAQGNAVSAGTVSTRLLLPIAAQAAAQAQGQAGFRLVCQFFALGVATSQGTARFSYPKPPTPGALTPRLRTLRPAPGRALTPWRRTLRPADVAC